MKTRRPSFPRERGAALMMVLIFLVVLTLLGTAGTMNNAQQERMAGNTRNRDLAFQAAEHALTNTDNWISGQTLATLATAATVTAGDGVRDNGEAHADDLNYWTNTFDWTSADLKTATSLDGLPADARYVVERMPSGNCPADPTSTCAFYRVTARGVGAVTEAVVILQSMYAIN